MTPAEERYLVMSDGVDIVDSAGINVDGMKAHGRSINNLQSCALFHRQIHQ